MKQSWKKLGNILSPKNNYVKSTHVGPTYILHKKKSIFEIYYSHRGLDNKSHISKFLFCVNKKKILKKSFKKILNPGKYGFFDSHGVSYPSLLNFKNKKVMFYVGWQKGIKNILPFKNNLGLCQLSNKIKRLNKAPVLKIDEYDPLNIGSCHVMKKKNIYIMWYTSFLEYKKVKKEYRHIYTIKYATSNNLIDWDKNNNVCITLKKNEFAISKPSVIFFNRKYHMWFCVRGKNYKIGYANSKDGFKWKRFDKYFSVYGRQQKWDNLAMAYPAVSKLKNKLYMIYTGNNYGKTGIGMLEMKIKKTQINK